MFKLVSVNYIQHNIEKLKELDREFTLHEENRYYIMSIDNVIKGYAEIVCEKNSCEIFRIYISEELRYKGSGIRFVKNIERDIMDQGCDTIITKNLNLTKFFEKSGFKIKDNILVYDGIIDRKKRYNENRKIIVFSILGNVVLAITKIIFGLRGNSRALFADGINSLSDVGTSVGMYIGVYFSNQPADDAHPYGHEKIESVIANIIGIFMVLTAFEIGKGSVYMLYDYFIKGVINTTPNLNVIWWGVFSAVVKYGMYYYKLKVGEKTSNHALIADAKDSKNDIFTSLGSVIGIFLAVYVSPVFDILLSIPVAILMLKEGLSVIFENANLILDKQDKEFIEEVESFIMENNPNLHVHNIMMRTSGDKFFLNLHIRVPKDITVEKAHQIADILENSICTKFENVTEVLIHIEPTMK